MVGRMHMAIEDKFSGGKEGDPIVLVGICEESKVTFNFLVRVFCLTIRLGMVCGGKHMSNA